MQPKKYQTKNEGYTNAKKIYIHLQMDLQNEQNS